MTTEVGEEVKPRVPAQSLRNLSPDFCFARDSYREQLAIKVFEYTGTLHARELGGNETLAMALNEQSSDCSNGFFLHMRNRESFSAVNSAKTEPSRNTTMPLSADYPGLVFINFAWSSRATSAFRATSQRARYLSSDGFINLPSDLVPVYALQYISRAKMPVYDTDSLLILATPRCFYAVPASKWSRMCKANGYGQRKSQRDRQAALRCVPSPPTWLFAAGATTPPDPLREKFLGELQPWSFTDVKQLHSSIVGQCCPGQLSPTMSTRELRQVMPCLVPPIAGTALGQCSELTLYKQETEGVALFSAQSLDGVIAKSKLSLKQPDPDEHDTADRPLLEDAQQGDSTTEKRKNLVANALNAYQLDSTSDAKRPKLA